METINLTLYTQHVKDLPGLQNGITQTQNLLKAIGLDLQVQLVPFIGQLTSYPIVSASGVHTQNIIPSELFPVAPDSPLIAIIYDWQQVTGMTVCPNPCENETSSKPSIIQMAYEWYSNVEGIAYPEVFTQFFLHEICHYLYAKSGQQDITHLFTDGNLQAQYSQLYATYNKGQIYSYYVYLISNLKQYWHLLSKPSMQTVTIQRGSDDGVETLGVLTTGSFSCKTLERSASSNPCRIPSGTYECIWVYQGDLNEYHYELQNVPGFTGVFIHEGNYYTNTLGCILLGATISDINGDGQEDVVTSRVTLSNFETLMGRNPFTLIIS